jgi:hypothetical protein
MKEEADIKKKEEEGGREGIGREGRGVEEVQE